MYNTLLLQAAGAPGQQDNPLLMVAFMLAGLGIFYFFMIRPQVQQQKAEDNFTSQLKKGKKVVTGGGIHGTVTEIGDKTVSILIAPKTIITVQKAYISLALTDAAYGSSATKGKEEATA